MRSSLLVLLFVGVAHADGHPGETTILAKPGWDGMHHYACWQSEATTLCERCSIVDGNTRCTTALDETDRSRLAGENIVPANLPLELHSTAADGKVSVLVCRDDNKGGRSCLRCNPNEPCHGDLTSDELATLTLHNIVPSNPPEKRYTVATEKGGLRFFYCRPDNACDRCALQNGAEVCTKSVTAEDQEQMSKAGVAMTNPLEEAKPSAAPPPARDEPYEHKPRGFSFALELGAFDSGDGKNIYSTGLGRGWMLGYSMFEFRIESYDLADQTKTYDNVANASGRAGIYSLVARPTVFTAGPIQLVGTIGVALVTRPSLRDDPDDVDSDIVHLREQWGGALVIGGGVRIYDLVTVDVRAYPTAWSGISGNRAEADDSGKLVMTPLADSPGGVPLSINAGIGLSF